MPLTSKLQQQQQPNKNARNWPDQSPFHLFGCCGIPPAGKQRKHEELANCVSHGIGVVLAITACYALRELVQHASCHRKWWSAHIYGATLITLYLSSTWHHFCQYRFVEKWPIVSEWFRKMDHSAVYFFIAGSHTPWMMIFYNETSIGVVLLNSLWVCSAVGFILVVTFPIQVYERFKLYLYIVMASVPIFKMMIFGTLPFLAIVSNVISGLSYAAGVPFYLMSTTQKSLGRMPYAHTVWHCFVLTGSIIHFFSTWIYAFVPDHS